MDSGLRYRLVSVAGTALLTVAAVFLTNLQTVHETFAMIPFFGNPAPEVLPGGELRFTAMTTLLVVLAAMWPLFKPQPRRILDAILLTQKRVFLAMVLLAAIGYFKYSYRLPRTTLMLTTVVLFVALPVFVVTIRRRPRSSSRAVIIGDDPEAMDSLLAATNLQVIGYVSPPSVYAPEGFDGHTVEVADGGNVENKLDSLPCLGGFARLETVLLEHDVDTVLLAFSTTDREDFFGTLESCYDKGINVLVHRDHAEHVLTDDFSGDDLLEVDLEPWDWQDYVVKRVFDVAFAGAALVALSPVIFVIALAIKIDDGGPLLYRQERTATFGDTFTIAKFRSMVPDAESETGAKLSEEDAGGVDQRITCVGRALRETHLDEIPQLWSILTGDMSVVGPRPERPELDADIQRGVGNWRRRWFVKPGLTGLAQINDATGYQPKRKLRYDIEYIRRQSFWFDVKIVVRQLWKVGKDAGDSIIGRR
ncbi:sugar transferase [Haloarchaeobius salinus]|uniref:sugar transferase n=1 Tax=Haloarchaeobius salinus TaxID=1198298 RepID=UPI00210EE0C5|nr:sugar transferase [Haloarchaeobius salinus]